VTGPGAAAATDELSIARVDELRAAFDGAFAEPIAAPVACVDVLAIRVGGVPHAIARAELSALRTDLRVVALPSPAPALLGVATFRTALVPVWDLGLIVHGAPVWPVRWCAILRDESAAFAFDRLDGHLRVAAPLAGIVEHADEIYAVLDVAGALAGLNGAGYGG
jgi:purine-binding chemotaxis protein CheW